MLNIEQELELSLSDYTVGTLRERVYDGRPALEVEVLRRGYHYDTWHFDAATGVQLGQERYDEPCRLRPKSDTRAINHFYLHAGYRDWPKEQWVKLADQHFSDGGSASERMKQHNGLASTHLSPFRFVVKKEVELSPVRDYPAWAEFRFASGDWERVPWADEPWAQTPETAHHFAHLSKADDSKVAWWATEADACSDTPITLAPGKYLQRYFGDVLTPSEIRDWAVKVDAEAILKFAHTADEIYHVYNEENGGPSSCMRYPDHSTCHDGVPWRSGINPVRAYAAGDLAVAYIERKGKIAGRALVWPAKKIAGRRYGDVERLNAALEAEGYTFDGTGGSGNDAYTSNKGGFNGARLLKIVPEGREGNYVMPYLDFQYRFDVGDEFLTLSNTGCHYGNRTDGLAFEVSEDSDDDTFTCEACGDEFPEDDYFTIEGDETWYCQSCYNARTYCCERCDAVVGSNTTVTVNDDEEWCRSCADLHSTTCDYCHDRYGRDDIVPVHDARYEPGEEPDQYNEACRSCRDTDAGDIQQDVNGVWIDVETATCCDHCCEYFNGNLEPEECPSPTCVDRRAAAETLETENA